VCASCGTADDARSANGLRGANRIADARTADIFPTTGKTFGIILS
jgi:hypothetical protein